MTNPLVVISIPCYKYEQWLYSCIRSLEAQMYRPLHIVVVHDGCDEYRPTIETVSDSLRRTTIYRGENRGVSYCRNDGLDAAQGRYVWFLDSDDMAIPGGIEARVEYLEKHPDVDMVWGNARKINETRHNWDWNYAQCMEKLLELERYSRRLNAQTLLWRASVFARFGGYFEGLRSKEDKELLFRLGLHPDSPFKPRVKAKHLDVDVAIYRRHPGAKHKKRVADKKWSVECERVFADRIKQLKRDGITKENTRFPIWA